MNMKQAKRVRELTSSVYDQSMAHTEVDISGKLNRLNLVVDKEARKEKVIREMLFELMELFPEAEDKLPCDEPDY